MLQSNCSDYEENCLQKLMKASTVCSVVGSPRALLLFQDQLNYTNKDKNANTALLICSVERNIVCNRCINFIKLSRRYIQYIKTPLSKGHVPSKQSCIAEHATNWVSDITGIICSVKYCSLQIMMTVWLK